MTRNRLILAAAGILIVAVAWYFVLIAPKADQLSTAKKDLSDARSQQQSLAATLKRLQDLDRERPARQAQLQRLAAAIPAEPDLAGFLLSANDLAIKANVDWVSIAPAPPSAAAAGLPSQVSMQIQIQGGFFQVLDYLNRIENLPRIVVVDSVQVSASQGGDSASPVLTLALSARMFTTAAATAAGASTTTTGPGGPGTSTTTTITPTTLRPGP